MTEKVLTVVCALITITTIGDFVEKVFYVLNSYNTTKSIQYKTIHVLAIYPIVSLAYFVALCIPRAILLSQLICSVYISRCMYVFIMLMVEYFGGSKKMMSRLNDVKIVLQTPPCCCCCCCLPKLTVNLKNIRKVKVMVLQNAILQPLMTFITMVLWIDERYTEGQFSLDNSFPYLSTINLISTIFAIYGFMVFFRLCSSHLKPAFISPKFRSLELVLLLRNLQGLIFSVLAKFNIPPCMGVLSSTVRGQAYMQMVLVLEMFLLSLLARNFYHRPHDMLACLSDNDKNEESHKICGNNIDRDDSDMPLWTADGKIVTQPLKSNKNDSFDLKDKEWLNHLKECSVNSSSTH